MYRHVCCLSEARRRARVLVRATDAQLACDRVIHYTQRSFGRSRVLRSGLAPVLRAGRSGASGKQDEWKTSENNPYLPYGRYSSVQRLLYDGCYSGYISPQSGVLSYSMCAAMFQGVVGVLDVKGLT